MDYNGEIIRSTYIKLSFFYTKLYFMLLLSQVSLTKASERSCFPTTQRIIFLEALNIYFATEGVTNKTHQSTICETEETPAHPKIPH